MKRVAEKSRVVECERVRNGLPEAVRPQSRKHLFDRPVKRGFRLDSRFLRHPPIPDHDPSSGIDYDDAGVDHIEDATQGRRRIRGGRIHCAVPFEATVSRKSCTSVLSISSDGMSISSAK